GGSEERIALRTSRLTRGSRKVCWLSLNGGGSRSTCGITRTETSRRESQGLEVPDLSSRPAPSADDRLPWLTAHWWPGAICCIRVIRSNWIQCSTGLPSAIRKKLSASRESCAQLGGIVPCGVWNGESCLPEIVSRTATWSSSATTSCS